MSRSYVYPHIELSVTAKKHLAATAESDATILLAVVPAKKGPMEPTIESSLNGFVEDFGTPSLDELGSIGPVVANWLINGGRVLVKRVIPSVDGTLTKADLFSVQETLASGTISNDSKSFSVKITAKYPGLYYAKGITFSIAYNSTYGKYTIRVIDATTKSTLEEFSNISLTQLTESVPSLSKYIGSVAFTGTDSASLTGTIKGALTADITDDATYNDKDLSAVYSVKNCLAAIKNGYSLDIANSELETGKAYYSKGGSYYSASEYSFSKQLLNKNAIKFDMLMDAGYPEDIKKELGLIANARRDAFVIIDDYSIYGSDKALDNTKMSSNNLASCVNESVIDRKKYYGESGDECPNIAVYRGLGSDKETYSGKVYWFPLSYFLASNIAYNDSEYGIQYPSAGKTRGKLANVRSIDNNPTDGDKISMMKDCVNYIERDSTGTYFMSNETYHKDYDEGVTGTALDFINNARVVCKMRQDLREIGRNYLHELNDAETLSQMKAEMNKYVNQWVLNRALSAGEVTVARSQLTEEEIDVTLSIKFTGTIEFISIGIDVQ
jgi:hypothetical protein